MPLRLVVYSDYLCPWCYSASARLGRLREELCGRIEFEWRSYLLRPQAGRPRDPERFRAYTRSWLRVGAEDDSPTFHPWRGEEAPPSHSVPPQCAAKAAARLGPDAFDALHGRLLRAYFEESRNITERANLEALWAEAGLPAESFAQADDPAIREQVHSEYREAIDLGITGVPTVRIDGDEAFVMGAQPLAVYRRWAQRRLAQA